MGNYKYWKCKSLRTPVLIPYTGYWGLTMIYRRIYTPSLVCLSQIFWCCGVGKLSRHIHELSWLSRHFQTSYTPEQRTRACKYHIVYNIIYRYNFRWTNARAGKDHAHVFLPLHSFWVRRMKSNDVQHTLLIFPKYLDTGRPAVALR